MKNVNNLNLGAAKEWFNIADNEFGFAELGLKDDRDNFYAQICFLYEQVVEKYLKGYLVANNINPKKVHDLGFLCRKCAEINFDFKKFISNCEELSQFYIPARYPSHWQSLTKEQALFGKSVAKDIIQLVKSDLNI